MKLSVIIPCRNGESYLAHAIGSVLDQSLPPHEIIVVDDGSTDGSLAVAQQFAVYDPDRIRVLAEHSGQAARTRNLGAGLATGDALLFLDADDLVGPDTLASLAAALKRHPGGGIAICPWYRLVQVDGRWVKRPRSCSPRRAGDDALSAWLTGWYHPPCSVLWSREAFEQAGRWDERWNPNDDGDLMMRALVFGIPLLETESGAAYYRRTPQMETSLSDGRFTREGVTARIYTIQKIAYLLQERRRLRHYRLPISSAFHSIAESARERHSDLCELAESYARTYTPTTSERTKYGALHALGELWRRVARLDGGFKGRFRTSAGSARLNSTGTTPEQGIEEITYGAARADVVRRSTVPDRDVTATSERETATTPDRVTTAARSRSTPVGRPIVSVIIPTYNRAELLRRAIDSVLAQTFDDYEVLVVDDGSTDDTAHVIRSYDDDRLRYLRQQVNRGVSAARNRGLRAARGEFVAFLDSDDEWLPDKLTRQIDLFRASKPDLGLVYTGVESVFEDGDRKIDLPNRRGKIYDAMLLQNVIHGGGSNVMVRRNVVATVGFFDEEFSAIEDYDYWLRISRFFEIDFVEDVLIRYHDTKNTEHGRPARKSLAIRANLEAREHFYRKHRREMRSAGVAHLFLVETARRHVVPSYKDAWGARRLAMRAILEDPGSRHVHKMIQRVFIPSGLRQILVTAWRAVRQAGSI